MPVSGTLHQLYLLSPSENVSLVDDTVLLASPQMGTVTYLPIASAK